MKIKNLIVILSFIIRATISYSQTDETIISNLFNHIPLDSSKEMIISFLEKSSTFATKEIYISDNGREIRGSLKSIKYFEFKADTVFFNTTSGNDLQIQRKTFQLSFNYIFISSRKAKKEFKAIKKFLDQIIDTSLRKSFTINQDKFLNYYYHLTKSELYPIIKISLDTERDFRTNRKIYKVLKIQFIKI